MTPSWTPVFSKIVDSSIWAESDSVCKIWVTLLALQDSHHVVRMSAYDIGQRARKGEAEVLEALAVLSSPDTKRIEKQAYDGRRIERVEGGWLILNGEYYQKLMSEYGRRATRAAAQKARRERRKAMSGKGGGAAEGLAEKGVVPVTLRSEEEKAVDGYEQGGGWTSEE